MSTLLPSIYPVTCHTCHVGPGSIFVAIQGFHDNGNKYIELAIIKGAVEIILEQQSQLNTKYPHIKFTIVDDARKALALRSASALGNPTSKLNIIGITGTKGKTTTAFLIEHFLKQHKAALIGTIKNKILDQEENASLTTPEADTLQMLLAECVKKGVTHVVMEISSHALSLNRVYGIELGVACFTNLASEHMDFYKSMDHYFEDKCKIFKLLKPNGIRIVNKDDIWGAKIQGTSSADFTLLSSTIDGIKLSIDESVLSSNMIGRFNAYNISMAFKVGKALGVTSETMSALLKDFKGVPGRLQSYKLQNGANAFVDFAHNPSSMKSVLVSLRIFTRHLIVVFGCGGDRDKTKRPVMGRIASKNADVVIVTSDNPRFEDRNEIIKEVLMGVDHNKTIVEPDRALAINKAVKISKQGSIIAILGKGHEVYFYENGKKSDFDDFKEISKY